MNIVLLRALMISLILVLAGCGGGGSNDNDDDSYGASEREFEGYGSIDSAGVTIQGIRIVFITTTYFELYDRQVEKAVFLAAVSGSDKFEVKTRVNSAGTYEALKIELDD